MFVSDAGMLSGLCCDMEVQNAGDDVFPLLE